MDQTQYQALLDELKCISKHLEEIKREQRERQRAEKEFWAEVLSAIGAVEMAIEH
jgi:hypothetical protein